MRSIASLRTAFSAGPAARGRGRRTRFDRRADLAELDQKGRRELALEQPAEHVRVEQVPAVFRLHPSAAPWPGPKQALGGENFDRFAQHRTARAVMAAERSLDRERIVPGIDPGNIRDAEIARDTVRQILPMGP